MGKKKRAKPKPLLSTQGIVHLQNSFVQPSDESGLLSTVGGKNENALVLAPNYGYGIPASTLNLKSNDKSTDEQNHEEEEGGEKENLSNGSTSTKMVNGSHEDSPDREETEDDHSTLSVAQLVRNIGGAKNRPLYQRDVVEDRDVPPEVITLDDDKEEVVDEQTQAQTDEFYASIGLSNPKEKKQKEDDVSVAPVGSEQSPPISTPAETAPTNQTDSIVDYYKTYCHYYYSVDPDPLSDQPLEFSSMVDPNSDPNDSSVIELAKAAQKARRAMNAAIAAKREQERKLQEEAKNKAQRDNDAYDPLPMEIVQNEYEVLNIDNTTTLTQYWDYVKENPHDFNRWTYLIHYVETINNLNECRKAYSAFLPLFPYCFGYWKRYAEIEKAHHYFYRALSILTRGLEFTPLSVDLWLSYLNLFSEVHAHDNDFEDRVREQFNKGIRTLGLEFRSDAFWEAYIQWESNLSHLKNVFAIYRRLIQVPTRLYNRHCDNIRVLVRDHHPRDFLTKSEYERLRKKGCKLLKLKYKPEPELEAGEIRKTSKPEDKLMAHVKEVILQKIDACHTKNEIEVNKRWDYEEKIKRPYFHMKALDKRQLKNWDDYINFEIKDGNHDRIVLLFERCITACAHYEFYWCKYSRYLENYHKKNSKEISVHFQKSQINVELISKKETEEEESRIEAALSVIDSLISEVERLEESEFALDIQFVLNSVLNQVVQCYNEVPQSSSSELFTFDILKKVNFLSPLQDDTQNITSVSPANLDGNSSSNELPPKSGEHEIEQITSASGYSSLLSVPTFPPAPFRWQEVVRDIYKRGSIVHCPRKPTIRLQWAAYEEELGNITEARQFIQHVLEWFPNLLEAKLQMLEFERRNGCQDVVIKFYESYLKETNSKDAFSILSLKYSRYLFKELGKPDKALQILRKAVSKDKKNYRLYSAIYSLCYERFPSDRKGALAALELAIQSKHLTDEEKLIFHKRKLLFLQEHGDLVKYRDAVDQFNECRDIVELQKEEEMKLKAYDVLKDTQPSSDNNVLLQPFPVPTWSSVSSKDTQRPIPIEYESGVETPSEPQINISQTEGELYKEVPPTRELLVTSDYGYSYKHPEQRYINDLAQKEYEKLESKGYPEHLKNKEEDKSSSKKRKAETPLYIVAPKGSYLMSYLGGPNSTDNPPVPGGAVYLEGNGTKRMKLEAPLEMTSLLLPTSAPCINIPDWFVKEGGELCLSETRKGFSILRYWPHFLTEAGNKKMFKSIRRGVKWHQKQILIGSSPGVWRHIPRLISWLGPCEYSHNGMVMDRNEDWPPEVIDLLHRLIQLTQYEFNSCSLNLYRTGHDSNAWHSDIHKALGSNPPIASVSLGALRYFELRKKGYEQNFIRFPLFPGSLLLMEGATQEDWVHQIPKDPSIKAERINLTFRIMHAVEDPDALAKGEPSSVDAKTKDAAAAAVTPTSPDPKSKEVSTNETDKTSIDSKAVPESEIKSKTNEKSSSKSIKSSIPRISFRKSYTGTSTSSK